MYAIKWSLNVQGLHLDAMQIEFFNNTWNILTTKKLIIE